MLASEEHHMKTHKNQQLLTMPSPLGPLPEPCARGQTSVPEGQKPLERPCMRRLVREVCSQSIDCKALSWGIIRKPTCILAEITIRKSQGIVNMAATFGSCSNWDDRQAIMVVGDGKVYQLLYHPMRGKSESLVDQNNDVHYRTL